MTNEYTVTSADVIRSAEASDLEPFEKVAVQWGLEHSRLSARMLSIFRDLKSPTLNRCFAAYYLGELHSSEAAEALAPALALHVDLSKYTIKHYPVIAGHPVVEALIKIGCPSIPAVIQNLKDSDDTVVKELSLEVLYRVEGEKDVVQSRLRRAAEGEQDPARKARLQNAIDKMRDFNLRTAPLR